MENLKAKSILANTILETETQYLRDKNAISKFFNTDSDILTIEVVEAQLTIINSYYSTAMSMRYYGIEDIAKAVIEISSNQKVLKNLFIEYIQNPYEKSDITKLFHGKYGCNKLGKETGQATSLVSKYAYFITDYNFPIYDSIVREVYPLIAREKLNEKAIVDFVKQMRNLLELSGIENFNKLDNLLWLIGKINRGNYSLILGKENYISLTTKIANLETFSSSKIDDEINKYIKENIDNLSDIFSQNQIDMIRYSILLKENNA